MSIGKQIYEKLENKMTSKTIKKVFKCANELIQNIQFYAFDKVCVDGKDVGVGQVKISYSISEIYVETWNTISPTKCSQIKEHINLLNKLDDSELKKLYKEKMKGETEKDSKGAGLGFMVIVRKTKNKIETTCSTIDEKKSRIYFKTTIKTEN